MSAQPDTVAAPAAIKVTWNTLDALQHNYAVWHATSSCSCHTQVVLDVAEGVEIVTLSLPVLQVKYREALAAGLDAEGAVEASFGLVRTTLQLGVPCMCS
jgi:hypothetical protein